MQHYRLNPAVVEARLTAFERNAELFTGGNFAARAVALDAVQQVYQLLQVNRSDPRWGAHLRPLKQQANALETRLREADGDFFQALRHRIRSGGHTAASLRQLFDDHTRYRPGRAGQIHRGYDALDALVQGLIRAEQVPEPVQALDRDMVHYEPAPARAILDLVDQVQWTDDDVFYDLGSGLGHVAMLVHLMTGAPARGVEIDAAYSQHARNCAEELGLPHVQFLNCDARETDYADGTVFLCTPHSSAPCWKPCSRPWPTRPAAVPSPCAPMAPVPPMWRSSRGCSCAILRPLRRMRWPFSTVRDSTRIICWRVPK